MSHMFFYKIAIISLFFETPPYKEFDKTGGGGAPLRNMCPIMRYFIRITLYLLILQSIITCKAEKAEPDYAPILLLATRPAAATVTNVTPSVVTFGSKIAVTGTNFQPTGTGNKLFGSFGIGSPFTIGTSDETTTSVTGTVPTTVTGAATTTKLIVGYGSSSTSGLITKEIGFAGGLSYGTSTRFFAEQNVTSISLSLSSSTDSSSYSLIGYSNVVYSVSPSLPTGVS